MIVVSDLELFFSELNSHSIFSMDCETTGLKWQRGDYAFLWSFATINESYIVDLRKIDSSKFYSMLHDTLSFADKTILGINPKFDLHMSQCTDYKAKVLDASILRRLCHTNAFMVGAAAIAEEMGFSKLDTVKKWIQKNKAYRWEKSSSGDLEKIPRYDSVPDNVLYPYAAVDAEIAFKAYAFYMEKLYFINEYNGKLSAGNGKSIFNVVEKEIALTRVLFKLEKRGFLLDEQYCELASKLERDKVSSAIEEFKTLTGRDFKDSTKYFTELFGESSDFITNAPRTKKNAVSITDDYLTKLDTPIAKTIVKYRKANKKAGTYYTGFLDLKRTSPNEIVPPTIHTNFRQPQTATGRLSASEPNLQNVSNEDSSDNQVRGCFISPPDFYMVSVDYQAQEMRVLLDFAKELSVIEKVLTGTDLHQATADLMGTKRGPAKTINFGILYGMGLAKLADSLGISLEEAKRLKTIHTRSMSGVAAFTSRIIKRVKNTRKISSNWGRIYTFDQGFEYKAINYLIQGSSSEITKEAILRCEELLENYQSKLVLNIHDELIFYVHKDELNNLIPKISQAMRDSFEHEFLPMDIGIEIGTRWSELESYTEWQKKQSQHLNAVPVEI